MSDHSGKAWQFTFDANTGAVVAVFEIERGRVEREHVDSDESWSRDPVTGHVVHREWEHGRQEVTTYVDPDGDGLHVRLGPEEVGEDAHHGAHEPHAEPHAEDRHDREGDDGQDDHGGHDGLPPVLRADLSGWLQGVLRGESGLPLVDAAHDGLDRLFADGRGAWGRHEGIHAEGQASEGAHGLPMLWQVLLVGLAAIEAADWHA